MNKNQKGFSVVEILIVIVVIGLMGGAGWYVYSSRNKNHTTSQTAGNQTETNDPYTGWKTYTLKNDKVSFKYPSRWSLDDSTFQDDSDMVSLKGNDGFNVLIENGTIGHPSSDFAPKVLGFDTVNFLTQPAFVDYASGAQEDSLVEQAYLSKSNSNVFDTFPTMNLPADGNMQVSALYIDSSGQAIKKTLPEAQADNNYKAFKLLIESMSY